MLLVNEAELARVCKKVIKVWGEEFILINNEKYCCKFLKINPGFRSSIHKHIKKDETFVGIQGSTILKMYQGSTWTASYGVGPGIRVHIKPETWHSFEAQSLSWIMEVSTPHSDDDVVRLEESRNLNEERIDNQRSEG